jgi:hypothetical protein
MLRNYVTLPVSIVPDALEMPSDFIIVVKKWKK